METSRSQPATPQIEDPTEHRLSVLSLASSHHYNSASPHRPITVSSNSSIPTSADGHRSHGSLGESLNVASPQNASATEESRLDSQHKLEKSNTSLQSTSRERWQPVYLKKYRLVVFPLLFLSFIVTIQVLVRVSEVNNGLVTPSTKLHYLWTFGPMTTLTLAAALWARVEFQVKSVAPWAHMMDGQSGDKTLLLDYLAMLQPMAIVKAVKSRDWAVASASSCSLILRITIIFSTALIALAPTEVHDTVVPVPIHSSFLDSMAELENLATNVGSLPRYSMRGLSERNLSFPDGTWSNYAFQQFSTTNVLDGRLNITVEGFTSQLSCQSASLNTTYSICDPFDTERCWALSTQQCQFPIPRPDIDRGLFSSNRVPPYYGKIGLSGCNNSSSLDDLGLYLIFGKLQSSNGTSRSESNNFSSSVQILCRASYGIDRVDVTSNHTGVISVSKSKTGSSRKIKGLEEGSMLRLYLSSFETPTSTASRVRVNMLGETGEPEVAQLDSYFEDLLSFAEIANPPASRLFNDSFLEEILSRYYQQDTVFIARSVFSTQASDSVTGRLDSKRERLLVSPATGHTMTAFLSVAIIFSILVVFTKPRLSSMPKNPNSVIGTTQLLADSNEILSLLSSFGPVSWETIKNRCCGFQFRSTIQKSNSPSGACTEAIQISVEPNDDVRELRYLNAPAHSMKAPLVLNTVSMISVQIIIIGTIAALEIILRISGASNDFVDVSDQQYIHLTWTILPALFFSLISMYFAAVDSEVRSLTPYYKLYKGSSLSHMITLDLLDGSTPRLLWREYRTDSFPALATTACLLMSSFFTIFVGSLYSVVTLPNDETIGLRTLSSFNTSGAFGSNTTDLGKLPDFSSLTSTLILDSNLSYPSFTYETLAFPEFSVIDTPRKYQILPSDAINITIPALRSKMTCTRYSSSEIQMEVISAPIPGVPSSHQSHRETLAIDIKGVPHQSLTVPNGLTHNVELPLNERPDSDWIFGIADTCKSSGRLIWCSSDFLYVWGHKTNSSDQVGNHVSALACNESIEAVDTSTTFFGAELRIDPSVPPRPVNDSARTSTVSVHHSNGYDNDDWLSPYDYLAEGLEAPGTNLWPFFNLLTTSRYGIPVADLDNPQRDESVARAIIFQHGIIRAQVLNEGFRGPANMTNATLVNPPADPEMANDAVTYNGTLSSAEGRLRLAQDPATTRVLEALLAAALLLSAAGRLLMPSPKLLPRNPTSIANVAALVADGNILSILPENPQHVPDKDILAASGGGYLLRLGWWASSDGDNSRQRFGIFAVKISQESVFGWL